MTTTEPERPEPDPPTAEHERLVGQRSDLAPWRLWGPYVAARQWGTVREDYSADGDAWGYLPFDQAHARAYRWGEDGIAGLSDRFGFLNLAVAAWNGRDDRLKERWFGLSNPQGNHGEDVKEYWWHLDATPTHSYAQLLYRYPQAAFPYADLVATNAARGRTDPEYELSDTGVLADDRFFDIVVTHAKASPDHVLVEITATNHGPDPAPLHLVPQLWFRNTWSWGRDDRRPTIGVLDQADEDHLALVAEHAWLGRYVLTVHPSSDGVLPRVLFCDNETDTQFCYRTDDGQSPHPTNAINDAVVAGQESRLIDPASGQPATKAALWWDFGQVPPGGTVTIRLQLASDQAPETKATGGRAAYDGFQATVSQRRAEADQFYGQVINGQVDPVDTVTARRAFAGLLWGRKLYRYDVTQWLQGDPAGPVPPESRWQGRNHDWRRLALADVMSMPDEWEYAWFAAWDLAFHCVALAHVDPDFAKEQLVLLCREWAMNPDGQIPAYEWDFGDVNPPVHAWAAWAVYALDGYRDHNFLVQVATKLLLNTGWWVNRKDPQGSDLFSGGFLGMDNIGPFDRDEVLPQGQRLEQSDATSWMAFFFLSMLRITMELARTEPGWQVVATKYFEHFLLIAEAMDAFGTGKVRLWDDVDEFYYDVIVSADGADTQPVRVRSLVGLLPLLGVGILPAWVSRELPDTDSIISWLRVRRPELVDAVMTGGEDGDVRTLSLLSPDRLTALLRRMLDEDEFLSPPGIRSLSKVYGPGFKLPIDGADLPIHYTPAESQSAMFGGNSNWRGPVWFPHNALFVEALRTYAAGFATDLQVEMPTGSGRRVELDAVADDLARRLVALFRPGQDGRRPSDPVHVPTGPLWSHPTFSEYFHGDTGAGLGASHQTGWTAMVAHLICTGADPATRSPADG